eukprot:GHRR01000294.1.p1 GENE.GHRR01000294.1~~GHRR01000294.1.p1  ORF type:complete len:299 (+),score=91.65 GHRR01000294.1:187-1083(+)
MKQLSQRMLLLLVTTSISLLAAPPSAATSLKSIKITGFGANAAYTAKDNTVTKPWFCRGLDCPLFDVVETKGHLQLRRYKSQCFIVTRVNAQSLLQAQVIGTKRLLSYLGGENEDGVKLPPTVPLNSVLLTADRKSETVRGKYYFALYLPEEVQGDAPKPNNRDVHIVKLPRRAVWVDTFDEPLLTESALIRRGWSLIKDLGDMGRKVDDRFFAFSLYGPPLPFVPHHYEIAVRARCRRHGSDSPDSPGSDAPQPPGGDAPQPTDDDDYPFPEMDGGDAGDDECDDESPSVADIFATI